jgi:hypothetical protein
MHEINSKTTKTHLFGKTIQVLQQIKAHAYHHNLPINGHIQLSIQQGRRRVHKMHLMANKDQPLKNQSLLLAHKPTKRLVQVKK